MAKPRRGILGLDPTVVSLGLVSLFNDIASEMIYPLLPGFLAVTLGAGPEAVGVVEGIAEATAAVGKGLFGWISDVRTRRKPFVAAGYGISVVARPLIALARAWGVVIGIRFADRIGKGVRTAPRDAMIAGAVDPARRGVAYGFERSMDNAGAFLGPLVAALLLRFCFSDTRAVFALSAVPGCIALLLVLFGTRERAAAPAVSPAGKPGEARLPRSFLVVIGIFTLFALSNSTDAFLLLRARDCGVAVWEIPLLWAAFNGAKSLLNTPAGSLSDRAGRIPSVLAGWVIYAAAYLGFARAHGRGTIWLLFLLYSLYYALTEGAQRALVADLAGERARGRAFGIFHMAVGIASLPASLLFGLLWDRLGARAAFEIDAALAIASAAGLAVFWLAWRRRS